MVWMTNGGNTTQQFEHRPQTETTSPIRPPFLYGRATHKHEDKHLSRVFVMTMASAVRVYKRKHTKLSAYTREHTTGRPINFEGKRSKIIPKAIYRTNWRGGAVKLR